MKSKSRLFYVPLGNFETVPPKPGETIDALHKRLARLARSYRQSGKAFRVERQGDAVLWWSVEPGQHTKLVWWYRLEVGESLTLKPDAARRDLDAARQTARYLRRIGAGTYTTTLEGTRLVITRISGPQPITPTTET